MSICEGSKLDWTAIAAIVALGIWLVDGCRRRRERAASRRLLSQIMTVPIMEAQMEMAKFRTSLVQLPAAGEVPAISMLASDAEARVRFSNVALRVRIDLPSQFVEKADLFGQLSSNRVANAIAQVGYFHRLWKILGEQGADARSDDVPRILEAALKQVTVTEEAINEALAATLRDGKASWWLRIAEIKEPRA